MCNVCGCQLPGNMPEQIAPDFINKLKIVEEELDESMFWLEFIVALENNYRQTIGPLFKEANELLSITVASIKTTRSKVK